MQLKDGPILLADCMLQGRSAEWMRSAVLARFGGSGGTDRRAIVFAWPAF